MGNLISWNGQEEACIGRTPELGYSFANKKILELLMIDTKSASSRIGIKGSLTPFPFIFEVF
jgi:hypothetical protein